MVIRLDIEIWVISKGGTKRGVGKVMGGWGKRYRGYWVLWPLFMIGCISVVVDGDYVRNCRGLCRRVG
jgi:hypothetical protein